MRYWLMAALLIMVLVGWWVLGQAAEIPYPSIVCDGVRVHPRYPPCKGPTATPSAHTMDDKEAEVCTFLLYEDEMHSSWWFWSLDVTAVANHKGVTFDLPFVCCIWEAWPEYVHWGKENPCAGIS